MLLPCAGMHQGESHREKIEGGQKQVSFFLAVTNQVVNILLEYCK